MIAGTSAVTELSAFGYARSTVQGEPLNDEEARQIHAFWRACNYLALGMIYLRENPLLREPLAPGQLQVGPRFPSGQPVHETHRSPAGAAETVAAERKR